MKQQSAPAQVGLVTALLLVVANMVGSGIFVTPGSVMQDVQSPLGLLLAFGLGGLLALCGALSYGELAAALPRSGGEYHYLARLYHPALGFISGWISLVVGFAAPIALSAEGFGLYTGRLLDLGLGADNAKVYASVLILLLTWLHTLQLKAGAGTQNVFTLIKVALILVYILAGLLTSPEAEPVHTQPGLGTTLLNPTFALALIPVYFAYSGWNAAAYLTSEIRKPSRTVPLALFLGSLLVMVLYLLLNYVFVRHLSTSQFSGEVEVGHLAAVSILGEAWGPVLTGFISFALISSVSSMIMAGPRVVATLAEDYPLFNWLAHTNRQGAPARAIWLQSAVALLLLLTSSFYTILIYVGFTLSLFAMLAVIGVYLLRLRPGLAQGPYSYRTWGYPLTPALFIGLCVWMIYSAIANNWAAPLAGGLTMLSGWVLYLLSLRINPRKGRR